MTDDVLLAAIVKILVAKTRSCPLTPAVAESGWPAVKFCTVRRRECS